MDIWIGVASMIGFYINQLYGGIPLNMKSWRDWKNRDSRLFGGFKDFIETLKFVTRHPKILLITLTYFLFVIQVLQPLLHNLLSVSSHDVGNVSLAPILNVESKNSMLVVFGWLYWFGLVLSFPLLAWVEEFIFRRGTHNWWDATVRSAIFGLCHLPFSNSPVLAITTFFTGLYFTWVYMRFGKDFMASTYVHAFWNSLALVIMVLPLLWHYVFEWIHV